MNKCIDCKYMRKNLNWHADNFQLKYAICEKTTLTGLPDDGRDCKSIRSDGFLRARILGSCGKEGRFWEPKDK